MFSRRHAMALVGIVHVRERIRRITLLRMSGPTRLALIIISAGVFSVGHATGHYPTTPLDQVADVVLILKPQERYSLHKMATVDRIIQGEIVHIEKGSSEKDIISIPIVHTRNTFTLPLDSGVPVKLYLSRFKDGHAYYIIGVSPIAPKDQP
jgi:hypothetical protein